MDIEKLIADITSDSESKRLSAVEKLCGADPAEVLPRLADAMLSTATGEIVSACFDVFDRFEASASMTELRMDGWFEPIARQIDHYDEITAILGDRFLPYAFALNVQIQSLAVDPVSPANTAVHFTLSDNQVQTLSLGEFKLRVIQALLQDDRTPVQPSLPFLPETAVAVLGGRNVLLAPLFGITIERVLLASLPLARPRYLVAFLFGGGFSIADLNGFLELIREHLQKDLLGTSETSLKIDLYAVERAREAAKRGESGKVVEILEAWPGLLSVLQRAPIKKSLDDEQLRLIGEGICLLGEALEKESHAEWSEELYKLGLQFIREGDVAGRLFLDAGRLLVAKEAYGEAIGYLRRARSLGVEDQAVLPSLGRAFLKRDCLVPAKALLGLCRERGFTTDHLEADLAEVEARLAQAGVAWEVPLPRPGREMRP